jgi:hypothetical protein
VQNYALDKTLRHGLHEGLRRGMECRILEQQPKKFFTEVVMRDRTLAVVLTILVIFLFGVPGLGMICLGSTSFLIYIFNSPLNLSPGWATAFNLVGLSSICIGFFLVLLTILISYLLLHRKSDFEPIKPAAPLPTEKPTQPIESKKPDEPLPPTI